MCRLFPCIPIFRWFFFIKSAKKICICDYFKNCINICKKCAFPFEKGYERIIALGNSKTFCSGRPPSPVPLLSGTF